MDDIEPPRFGNVFDRARNADNGNTMLPAAIAFGDSNEVQADPRRCRAANPRVLRERDVDDTRVE
jgi:hypothetical protein